MPVLCKSVSPLSQIWPKVSISREAFARATGGGKGKRFHDFRHEATTRLFELGGLGLMEVAVITGGHKTLSMLKRYTHLRPEDLAKKLA